ncbi:MAG TPA: metal-dependent hydrolase [Gammaproteobacteria bacterium]|nr:metal-dependent hydrolase [Gammaproteobacteria bacterium]
MDTLTHSLLGAVVVRSAFPAQRSAHPFSNRQRLLTGALAGAFPDIDYIAAWVDPMVYLTLWHRSITHSFVMLPLWALLVGVVLAFAFGQRREWRYLTLLAGVAVVSHIASDLITVYGTQILAPLSAWRASIGTTFIIDPWFTLIVLAGLVAGFSNTSDRLPRASLAVLLGYLLLQGGLKQQALSVGREHVQHEAIPAARVSAFPQPFSPFNWKVIVESDAYYDIGYTSLSGGYAGAGEGTGFWDQVRATYRSPARMQWLRQRRFGAAGAEAELVERLWHSAQLDYFRRFAELPVLYRIDREGGRTCVWFTDLRYVLPFLTPPFRYGLCRETPPAAWQLERLRD